jgi:hypothetical protein
VAVAGKGQRTVGALLLLLLLLLSAAPPAAPADYRTAALAGGGQGGRERDMDCWRCCLLLLTMLLLTTGLRKWWRGKGHGLMAMLPAACSSLPHCSGARVLDWWHSCLLLPAAVCCLLSAACSSLPACGEGDGLRALLPAPHCPIAARVLD